MSMFKKILLDFDVEWIRLKIFDESNIAIGCYRNKKSHATRKKKGTVTVGAFIPGVGPLDNETVASLPTTERKFRKSEKEVALFYFQELCRTFKDGIIQHNRDANQMFGDWNSTTLFSKKVLQDQNIPE